ncbi:hypothetical protein Tco_0488663 [Tanacetum coccineum]
MGGVRGRAYAIDGGILYPVVRTVTGVGNKSSSRVNNAKIQDYALWEVIENGNSWVPIPETTPPESGTSTTIKMTVPVTIEEKTCKKNDVKARRLKGLLDRLGSLGVVTPPMWMNKPDFDTMDLDDLYKKFKIVEQKVKKSAGASNDD